MRYVNVIVSFLFLFYGTFTIVYYGVTSTSGEIGDERSRKPERRKTG